LSNIGVPKSDTPGVESREDTGTCHGMDIAPRCAMASPLDEVRFVRRGLKRGLGTSLLVVATLAVVMGANTLTFSFLNEIILNPLPAITNKAGLVNVHGWRNDKDGVESFSYPAYQALAQSGLFQGGLVGFNGRGLSLERNSSPELVFGMLVSDNYFETLGVRPPVGRAFGVDDNKMGAKGVVVLSDSIWRTRFGADHKVIGESVRLNGHSFTVIGIGPPRFSGQFTGFAADLWIPITWGPTMSGQRDLLENRDTEWIEAFGRVRPGAMASAAATLTRINESLPAREVRSQAPKRILVEALTGLDRDLRAPAAAFLALLQGATLLVAVIALVNVSGLLLARSMERSQETAVRLALGASRQSLLVPFAIEAMVLCGLGALLGLALALVGARLVPGWLPPFAIPLRFAIELDVTTFGFSALVALVGTLMATLGPGLAAARSQPSFALREGGTQRTARSKWRSALVATQVAFATAVLVSGSVFARFLAKSASASPGFDLDRIQITRLDTSVLGISETAGRALQQRAIDAVHGLPGVERVGFARVAPYTFGTSSLDARDASLGANAPRTSADWNAVSPGFFETLGVGLARGRAFSEFDNADAPAVVVINQTLAARAFPSQDAVGRSLAIGPKDETVTVVGVVADLSLRRLGEAARPQIYRPFDQAPGPRLSLFIRSAQPAGLTPLIRPTLAEAAPGLPLLESLPLRDFASFSQTGARMGSGAGLALGGLGLALAAVGLFGLVAQTVASRHREIAIRMAVGATSAQILSLILREGGRLGLIGIAVGAAGALGLSPLLSVLIPDMSAMDPVGFLAAAVLVAVVTAGAIIGPAWRASRVSPGVALRAN
jgi:predicted permease